MHGAHPPLSLAAALALLASCAGCARPAGVIVPPAPIGAIDASSSSWRAISSVGAPPASNYHLIWTGHGLGLFAINGNGGFYDPSKDSWRAVAQGPGPTAQVPDPAFVSERSILLTGSLGHAVVPRAFDFASATWRSIPAPSGDVPASPIYPAQAWTGSALFVWGGAVNRYLDTGAGAIFDVASDAWRPVAREGAPSERARPVATWTGAAFFVWGGASRKGGSGLDCTGARVVEGCSLHADGALYDPVRERWSQIPAQGAPPPLVDPGILWTGSVVVLWDQTVSTPRTTVYAYDPRASRWLAPLVMPVAFTGRTTGVSAGRAVFLDQTGGQTLDVETKAFSPIPVPEDIRACWSSSTKVFEAARVVVISPAPCHGGTIAVSAFDPRNGTWKTASLPPVPRPHAVPGAPKGVFNGELAWTGEQLIAWGGTYPLSDHDTSGCSSPPHGMPCDPVGPSALDSTDGFILRPSL